MTAGGMGYMGNPYAPMTHPDEAYWRSNVLIGGRYYDEFVRPRDTLV